MHEAQRYGRRFRFLPRISDCYTLGEDDVVVMEYVWGANAAGCRVSLLDFSAAFADVFPRLCDAVLALYGRFRRRRTHPPRFEAEQHHDFARQPHHYRFGHRAVLQRRRRR